MKVKFFATYSAISSVFSSTSSFNTSEAVTTTPKDTLTLDVNLMFIVKLPNLLIGASREIVFLSTSIPNLALISSANFLVVIAPNNLPDSPAFAENSIEPKSSIFFASSKASACNFSCFALILAKFFSLFSLAPFVAISAKFCGNKKFLA